MLWLYLLGLVTFLTIVVRRLLRRQKPLVDEIYAKKLAIHHVHDGVAWVTDGRIRYMNPSLAQMLGWEAEKLRGETWFVMFPLEERERLEGAYAQTLLSGKERLVTNLRDSRGQKKKCNLILVTVHDHKMRLAGHYCIVSAAVRQMVEEEQTVYASS